VTAFVATSGDPAQIDTKFRQQTLATFSGGGWNSVMKPEDLPPGIFVSFKGHPAFRIIHVQFPIQGREPPLSNRIKTGVRVVAEFEHEPSNGECYFYLAVWTAVK
jgi:hypothetical protein